MSNPLLAIIISLLFGALLVGGVLRFIRYLSKRTEAQSRVACKKYREVKKKIDFLSILIVFIFFFSSIFVALFVFKYFKNIEITRKWKTTNGKILSASIKKEESEPTESFHVVFLYSPDIKYRYEVDGSQHEGSKYQVLEWSTGDQNTVHEIISKYVEGESCKVYYNPQNPSQSVLNIETPQWDWYFLIGGIVGYLSLPPLIRKRRSLTRKLS